MIEVRSETWESIDKILTRIEDLETPILYSEKQDHPRTQYARGKLKVVRELRDAAKEHTELLTHPI